MKHIAGCLRMAQRTSDDPDTQVGALIQLANRLRFMGANTLPRGVTRFPARVTRPGKYDWIEHAERGLLHQMAAQGQCTQAAVMYVTMHPCVECARGIIDAGLAMVVCAEPVDDRPYQYMAAEILQASHVGVVYVDWDEIHERGQQYDKDEEGA